MIKGVEFKNLVTHEDGRGFFREILRITDGFFQEEVSQLSHSMVLEGVIKAWHLHYIQTDWWYVCNGVLRVGLCDMRENSSTHLETMDLLMGDLEGASVIKIPPGVAHGYKVIKGPVNIFYLTSEIYNPDDEIRIPYDDRRISFDWDKVKQI